MRRLAARALVLSTLAFCACSDRSAPTEDLGHVAMAMYPPEAPLPLGPRLDGWRLPTSGDYNGDGMQDTLWRDQAENTWAVWLMRGTTVLERGPIFSGPPSGNWTLLTGGSDRNYDGMADLLWADPTANRMTVWLVRGTELFERGPEIPGPPGDGWLCVGARDFDGDGMPDVLWYNPVTNLMTVWLMRGTEPFERGPEIPGPGRGWFAVFGSDFDRDGLADVFWYNPHRDRMAVWLMCGTAVRARGAEIPTPPSTHWILASAGDYNRDFVPDLLWYDWANNRMMAYLMFGTELLEQGPVIPGPPGGDWILGNSADCDGDGVSDVIWLGANPLRMSVWLMNGPAPAVCGPEIAGP